MALARMTHHGLQCWHLQALICVLQARRAVVPVQADRRSHGPRAGGVGGGCRCEETGGCSSPRAGRGRVSGCVETRNWSPGTDRVGDGVACCHKARCHCVLACNTGPPPLDKPLNHPDTKKQRCCSTVRCAQGETWKPAEGSTGTPLFSNPELTACQSWYEVKRGALQCMFAGMCASVKRCEG